MTDQRPIGEPVHIALSRQAHDRIANRRVDEAWLEEVWQDSATRVLVIAKDLFSAFDPDDMFAPDVAHAYRDKVLAMGGRKDAADLVADFLGRPYSFDSWAAWLAE